MNKHFKTLLASALLIASGQVFAGSDFSTGAGTPITATNSVDFQITIPKVLFLQVGEGSLLADDADISLINFDVSAADLGNGVAVSADAGSGDLGNGTVTARVIGNNGDITLSSTTLGDLESADGDTIDFSEITTTAAALNSATTLAAPALASGATTSITISPATGKVVNRDATWTYEFANNDFVAAGTYGGVNTNNGRVVYTASMP